MYFFPQFNGCFVELTAKVQDPSSSLNVKNAVTLQ